MTVHKRHPQIKKQYSNTRTKPQGKKWKKNTNKTDKDHTFRIRILTFDSRFAYPWTHILTTQFSLFLTVSILRTFIFSSIWRTFWCWRGLFGTSTVFSLKKNRSTVSILCTSWKKSKLEKKSRSTIYEQNRQFFVSVTLCVVILIFCSRSSFYLKE